MKKLDTVRQGDVLLVYLGDEEVKDAHAVASTFQLDIKKYRPLVQT